MTSSKKDTGSYYTPYAIASFIFNHVASYFDGEECLTVLEPSLGDGSFLKAFNTALLPESLKTIHFTGIERDEVELNKARNMLEVETEKSMDNHLFIAGDFLECHSSLQDQFSLVIGNPPYINKKRLSKEQIDLCQEIHDSILISKYSVKNIWTSFLLRCGQLVKEKGVLAFVLPSELLQVAYTEDIRAWMYSEFARVEIINFKELVFENAGQDTIILIGYKTSDATGVFISTINSIDGLNQELAFTKHPPSIRVTSKDVHHELSHDELNLLATLKNRIKPISEYCTSKPGIVTGANNYFIVDRNTLCNYNLNSYSRPILQKSSFVNGKLDFTIDDYQKLVDEGKPAYFLDFNGHEESSFQKGVRKYIELGEKECLNERYKCSSRNRWFNVPNVSRPTEILFFKRCHTYPKMITNTAQAYTTDSAYGVTLENEYSAKSFIRSFYNVLTLIFAELSGRFYGGGVLELTPTEFKGLPIPYCKVDDKIYSEFAERFCSKSSILEFFLTGESAHDVLKQCLQIESEHLTILNSIHKKLLLRRVAKQ